MPAPTLVLLCCGPRQHIETLQQQAAAAVAGALELPLATALDSHPADLAALSPGRLTPLPVDPGLALSDGGHWAEALGAWRQSALVLLSSDQLASGTAAATTALLLQWQVPLLGLVQWGGDWDAAARAADGLPWLGWLDGTAQSQAAVALGLAARLRWRQLAAELG